MSTRGSLKVGGKFYYISSDSFPERCKPRILKALRLRMPGETPESFVKLLKDLGVYVDQKPLPKNSKFLGSFADEHRFIVSLAEGTVKVQRFEAYNYERIYSVNGWRVLQAKKRGKWVTTKKLYQWPVKK
jgi:hypothetical protein